MHPDARNRLIALARGVTRVTRVTGVTPPPLLQPATSPPRRLSSETQEPSVTRVTRVTRVTEPLAAEATSALQRCDTLAAEQVLAGDGAPHSHLDRDAESALMQMGIVPAATRTEPRSI
jgi:hypothetical protein